MRELCADIVELRRGDHSVAKLKLEQDRLKEAREKTEEEVIAFFQQWAGNPNVRAAICGDCTSPEERQRKIMEIFGRIVPAGEPEQTIPASGKLDTPELR